MRKAINDNPMVQLAVVGMLLVAFALLLMTRVMGGKRNEGSTPSATPATSAATGASADSTGTPSAASSASAPPTGAVSSAPTSVPGSVPSSALVPGPGLPDEVISAWKSGDAVVLLVVRGGGVDDRLVRRSVQKLSADPEISVFVTRAKNIARYSRITEGVGVNRVPALVVIRPKRISGSVPQAQVSYGFRGIGSVVQSVRDALYSGRDDIPYYPN